MIWIQIFSFFGSIGLFLYGMKLMSEGLQKITSDVLRNVHVSMTKNSFMAMLTGVYITALVMSSSATMIMSLSFVNAGLITLSQSLAVFMGANIGMTLINWIIAIFGFKYLITVFVFPIIALSLPFYQSNNNNRNSWGELLIGFALTFLGIVFLNQNFPDFSQHQQYFEWVSQINGLGVGSVLIYLLFGILITSLTQSSLVDFIIALLLCARGWIPFELGCAMVLGSNIGSSFASLQVSTKANAMSKRAARGFLLFNVLATVIAVIFFFPLCLAIEYLCNLVGFGDLDNVVNISLGIALFHTISNLAFIIIELPLIKPIEKLLNKKVPNEQKSEDSFDFQYISNVLMDANGELSLIQVRKETSRYANEVHKMFGMLRSMILEPLGSARQLDLHEQIVSLEADSDDAEVKIADFLNQISHQTLSWDGELLCRNLYKMVDELESIADSIMHMSTTLYNKQEQRIFFNNQMNMDIRKMFDLTETAIAHMCQVLAYDDIPSNALNKAYNIEDEINNSRNQFRNTLLESIDQQQIEFMQSTYFMMLVNECEKIGDYTINVVAAACEV